MIKHDYKDLYTEYFLHKTPAKWKDTDLVKALAVSILGDVNTTDRMALYEGFKARGEHFKSAPNKEKTEICHSVFEAITENPFYNFAIEATAEWISNYTRSDMEGAYPVINDYFQPVIKHLNAPPLLISSILNTALLKIENKRSPNLIELINLGIMQPYLPSNDLRFGKTMALTCKKLRPLFIETLLSSYQLSNPKNQRIELEKLRCILGTEENCQQVKRLAIPNIGKIPFINQNFKCLQSLQIQLCFDNLSTIIESLSKHPTLNTLSVLARNITNLDKFQDYQQLKTLELSAAIKVENLQHLCHVESLIIYAQEFNLEPLKHLKNLRNLEIYPNDSEINFSFSDCKSLKNLSIANQNERYTFKGKVEDNLLKGKIEFMMARNFPKNTLEGVFNLYKDEYTCNGRWVDHLSNISKEGIFQFTLDNGIE